MDTTIYSALSRTSALKTELSIIANNLANISTTGYRREGLSFSEYITPQGAHGDSISMTDAGARIMEKNQGVLTETGGELDFAIEGNGYFQLEGPGGLRLSRAGAFARNADGELVNSEGLRLLDQGGAPIQLPLDAREINLATDGSLSADGNPVAGIGLVLPQNERDLERSGGNTFIFDGPVEPAADATLHQGFLEGSNVNPLEEVARMIEVQRRYEAAKAFSDREHQRIKSVLEILGR